MINHVTGINHYGNRIKIIDKINVTSVLPTFSADGDWEYEMLCEKKK